MLYESELRRYDKWFKSKYSLSSDYSLKSFVISNSIDKAVNTISRNIYNNNMLDSLNIYVSPNCLSDVLLEEWYSNLAEKVGYRSIIEALRINNANYHRVNRLRDRIEFIINSGTSFFLTLTFTNKYLSSTSSLSRRKYVRRYLKSISNKFVANIDFGKKRGREHYHAVVSCDFIDSKLWKYGNLDFELVDISSNSSELLSKYVSKLTNHAIKVTTKRQHIIYSRL